MKKLQLVLIGLATLAAVQGNAQRLGIEMAHGINQGYSMFGEAIGGKWEGEVDGTLAKALQTYTVPGISSIRSSGVSCNTVIYNINQQVTNGQACKTPEYVWDYSLWRHFDPISKKTPFLPHNANISYQDSVEALASQSDRLVLLGFSQGGLRSREFLQQNQWSNARSKVRGLITLSTPTNGAPITLGGPIFAGKLMNAVNVATLGLGSVALGGFLGWTAGGDDLLKSILLGSIGAPTLLANPYMVGPATSSYVYSNIVGGGGGAADMTPGSSFLNRLNNIASNVCRMHSAPVYVETAWGEYWTTQWWQTCTMESPANYAPIPSNVGVLELVGRNNNIDDLGGPQMMSMRQGAATVMSVMAIGYWANTFLFQWWYAAPAMAASYLAWTLWDLHSVWSNEVVGSWQGDGVVPEASQKYISTSGAVGGDPRIRRFDNVDHGQHIGPNGIWKQQLSANYIRQFMGNLSMN